MQYLDFVEVYDKLAGTTKKIEKAEILAVFLKKLSKQGESKWVYLLRGSVLSDYDSREFGISKQLAIKALHKAYGISEEEIMKKLNRMGDIGNLASELAESRKQKGLFASKLSVDKVFTILHKLFEIEGKGAIDKKMSLISGLLAEASGNEAKYIVRTLLNDLRIGVANAILIDALDKAFFENDESSKKKLQEAYDLATDFAVVFEAAIKGKKGIENIELAPGTPVNVMLCGKVKNIEEGFEACGKPAAFEYKYDGFRVLIHKKEDGRIIIYTRRLENVTNQFPDVVEAVKKNVKGDNFIIDGEAVGFDSKTGKYQPFEAISQRIRRKYDIDKLISELPVELNIFDVLYYNGENKMSLHFVERRKLVEKIVNIKDKVIKPSEILITDNLDKAEKFYEKALDVGEEGIIIKNLESSYRQGRYAGYMVKLKPEVNDLDLVIVAAEYGTGKRGGWLTSYIVACKSGNEFLEVGKVSSGLKEKEEEGMTYEEMTKLLKAVKISEEDNFIRVKPKIVVSVTYQNMQKSPSYSSGYALRFPRITHYRPDKGVNEIATLKEIEKMAKE